VFALCSDTRFVQGAYGEAESIKLQDALIKEEEEAERLEDQRQAFRLAADREKKARKKVRRFHEDLRRLWGGEIKRRTLRFSRIVPPIF